MKDKIDCPCTELVQLWNTKMKSLPAVRVLSSERRKKLKAAWDMMSEPTLDGEGGYDTKEGGLEWWSGLLDYMTDSDFLMGRTQGNRNWSASFDFIIQKSSLIKLVEGQYHR